MNAGSIGPDSDPGAALGDAVGHQADEPLGYIRSYSGGPRERLNQCRSPGTGVAVSARGGSRRRCYIVDSEI